MAWPVDCVQAKRFVAAATKRPLECGKRSCCCLHFSFKFTTKEFCVVDVVALVFLLHSLLFYSLYVLLLLCLFTKTEKEKEIRRNKMYKTETTITRNRLKKNE